MKNLIFIISIIILLFPFSPTKADSFTERLSGRILLQTEDNGEAWYLEPDSEQRIYLGRPADAWKIMREQGLGVSQKDFNEWQSKAPLRLAGKIILEVEKNGEAWYIHPSNLELHYLGRPMDAFKIMRSLSLGISNQDLEKIPLFGTINKYLIDGVIFTPQAPFGDWADPAQQDGCEEASSLMAVNWALNKKFTRQEALSEIKNIATYEIKNFNNAVDTNVEDTANRIIKGYFNFNNYEIKNDINKNDLINEIKKGHLIITPTNGQKLNNPYFTAPGPSTHMLIIKGYDELKKVFITNDPGTYRGESFVYDEDILFEAILDYLSGDHEKVEKIEKNIIIIKKL